MAPAVAAHLLVPFFLAPEWLLELFQATALGLEESRGEGGVLYAACKSVCQLHGWTRFSPEVPTSKAMCICVRASVEM